jgi:hypothetical protein
MGISACYQIVDQDAENSAFSLTTASASNGASNDEAYS